MWWRWFSLKCSCLCTVQKQTHTLPAATPESKTNIVLVGWVRGALSFLWTFEGQMESFPGRLWPARWPLYVLIQEQLWTTKVSLKGSFFRGKYNVTSWAELFRLSKVHIVYLSVSFYTTRVFKGSFWWCWTGLLPSANKHFPSVLWYMMVKRKWVQ